MGSCKVSSAPKRSLVHKIKIKFRNKDVLPHLDIVSAERQEQRSCYKGGNREVEAAGRRYFKELHGRRKRQEWMTAAGNVKVVELL